MKRLATSLAVVFALGMLTSGLLAQETRPAPKKERVRRGARTKPLLYGAHGQMAKVCALSEEQQKKIAELSAERKKALVAFGNENDEKLKAVREELKRARASKDKEAVKKASTALGELNAERNEIVSKSQAQIMDVLTPEQRAKWDEYTTMTAIKGRFRAAKLTDDQLAKIKAEYVKLASGTDVGTTAARAKVLRELAARISKEILTEDQWTDVAVAQITRRYRKLKLTDEQLAQIRAAYLKHMAGVDTSKRGARAQAEKKLMEQIRTDILTDQQRELLPKPKVKERPKAKAKTEGGKAE